MTTPPHILIVEDEADMARVLEYNLAQQGYVTAVAADCRGARAYAQAETPELILLDVRLPDGSGLDVLQELKSDGRAAATPVIVVSAIGDENTVVEALNLGAEDYVAKPVRIHELLARVAAVLRRSQTPRPVPRALNVNGIALDTRTRNAAVNGVPAELTRTEFDLLFEFLCQPGRVFTRHQLCEALGAGGSVQERTIDAHVRTLRRKLGLAGQALTTVWGVGYRLVGDRSDGPIGEMG